jgi:hypothetical protein
MERKPVEKFDLALWERGGRVQFLLTQYLAWESSVVEGRNRDVVKDVLRKLLGQMASPSSRPRDWDRLAEGALTIGSQAVDLIDLRLRAVIIPQGPNFDYRSLAHQIYSMTGQARRLKNAVALRRKCAKAVLSSLDSINLDRQDGLIYNELRGPDQIYKWTQELFEHFASQERVSVRFLSTYESEWREFCLDAIDYLASNKDMPRQLEPGFRYEKAIQGMLSEAQKSKVVWNFEQVSSDSKHRPDISGSNGITVELKKRPDHFSFLINIPSLHESKLSEAPLAIMSILEKKPGFQSVDVAPQANDSRSIKIDIWDKYTMAQITVAQQEILDYFGSTEL